MAYILLGIIQGLTEFLPVSSSGHLVILQNIFGIERNLIFLNLTLHLGTLFSVLVFFRKDILALVSSFLVSLADIVFQKRISYIWRYDTNFRVCVYMLVGTAITGYLALSMRGFFDNLFNSTTTVIAGLFFTSAVLFFTKNLYAGQRQFKNLTIRDAIIFGLAQVIAIVPGISRSGLTVSILLFRNVGQESAFKFSFLASIPIIAGAFIVELRGVAGVNEIPIFYLVVGFFASFISGLAAIFIIRSVLKVRGWYKFSFYCFFLAALLLLFRLRGAL